MLDTRFSYRCPECLEEVHRIQCECADCIDNEQPIHRGKDIQNGMEHDMGCGRREGSEQSEQETNVRRMV